MSKQASPALIGTFVIGAIALAFVGLLVFGGGEFFTERERYIVFFSESVNGLNLGAPVKMRGVQVGKVKEILVQYDPKVKSLVTPVVIEVDLGRMLVAGSSNLPWQRPELKDLIDAGLRSQLKLQSLVTGQLYVDLNFYPGTEAKLTEKKLGLPEIPSIPSSQEEIESTMEELVKEFRQIPIKEIFTKFESTLSHLDRVVSQPELGDSVKQMHRVLQNLDKLTGEINTTLAQVGQRLDQNLVVSRRLLNNLDRKLTPLLEQSGQTLARAEQAFRDLSESYGSDSLLAGELHSTLHALQDSARQVRVLAETLQTQPETLLRGKQEVNP